jgi:DNA-binding transcriptional ArsR family regulator
VSDEQSEPVDLDRVLQALANPHRREIVVVLGLQPCAIHYLAQMRGLSLPAIHRHLKVLDQAGLIRRHKRGTTTFLTLNPAALRQLQSWLGQFHTRWDSNQATYENYDDYLGVTRDNGQTHPATET